ncbi:hypothetical protein M427DRAFT_33260 [Gonapodya prolifera JEL478]|uniref:Uncharacterized protein n=1 Tax=Gonapodya prolifera (strain JEL478) TaxID=1344416 RepID=A0A139AC52_GONPJ|nr:hypothetical protein M427DRAFT_33260 [Gonapodya prolifera JEL478]|eukprot:KXS14337.1 hypothetical protein M427DRAFT_33260 [Gonapodya prolifera JEL478]
MRTVVSTHATSGITRDCGPSAQFKGLLVCIAMEEYAIIAPDYLCLCTFPRNAVASTVITSRTALPKGLLSYDGAFIGHSEGDLSPWAINRALGCGAKALFEKGTRRDDQTCELPSLLDSKPDLKMLNVLRV